MLVSYAKDANATDEDARALQAAASYNDEAAGFLVSRAHDSLATDEEYRALLKAAAAGNAVALSFLTELHHNFDTTDDERDALLQAVAAGNDTAVIYLLGFLSRLSFTIAPEEEHAIAQAAACGNSAAIEFVEGRGEFREMRQQVDEVTVWYQKHEMQRGEMGRRHEEERKCSAALLMNEPDDGLAVLPPPSEEDTHLYKEALRHGDFCNMAFLAYPTFFGTPEAAQTVPPGQTPALPAWVRGELLKARQKREWAAMNSISEERQRFPDGGSPVEVQVRVEELAHARSLQRDEEARAVQNHESLCVVL